MATWILYHLFDHWAIYEKWYAAVFLLDACYIFSIGRQLVALREGYWDTTLSLSLPLGLGPLKVPHSHHSHLGAVPRSTSMWHLHNQCRRLWVTLQKSANTKKSSLQTSYVLHYGVCTTNGTYSSLWKILISWRWRWND